MSREVFADTAFWIGLSSLCDAFHAQAVSWSRHIKTSRLVVVTTEAVLWEWLNAMAQPDTRQLVVAAYHRCKADPGMQVAGFEDELMKRAVELFSNRQDKAWGITDCLSPVTTIFGKQVFVHC